MEGIEIEENHPKVIIHIDIDYFYAQVEEIYNPTLKKLPVGIQQKNIVVTCNYIAREFGVKKLMLITDAQKLCPNLVLVNGEDLTKYRDMSSKIFDIIRNFTPNVEKLGFDENFADVTNLVNERLTEQTNNINFKKINGYIITDIESLGLCSCGCQKRLIIGSYIAKEIRDKLYSELKITTCAGIAHNKILSKLVGSINKPNKQTTLAPCCATTFLSSLGPVRNIPGIGTKIEIQLKEINIETVQDLQDIDFDKLQKKIGYETAVRFKDLSYGRDISVVRPTGKPKTIGIEDSCKTICLKSDVEEKFRLLLVRLLKQVSEDGRIPVAIKIVLRKFDSIKKTSHRETKQCNILPSMFKQMRDNKIEIIDNGQEKLLKIIMRLFEKCVDMNKPFNITLLGLAFSKFQERKTGSRSIANFLIKKSDIEVQSVTNLSNESSFNNSTSRITSMESETISDNSITSDNLSETEIEPSPKKTRLELLIAKRRCCLTSSDSMDIASPSKLRVADLRLNSTDRENPFHHQINNNNDNNKTNSINSSNTSLVCPSGVDPLVFKELPIDVQNELIASWRTPSTQTTNLAQHTASTSTPKQPKSTLHRYFITNK